MLFTQEVICRIIIWKTNEDDKQKEITTNITFFCWTSVEIVSGFFLDPSRLFD
jgi:hypothetical protein